MSARVDGNNWKLLRVRVMLVTTSRHGRIFCFRASRAFRLTTAAWMLFIACEAAIHPLAGRFYVPAINDAQAQCEITLRYQKARESRAKRMQISFYFYDSVLY
ncbi:MAG: hypothetical protein RSC00_01350 [Ruthenibacterium sp.]